jgi:hypothetical protein
MFADAGACGENSEDAGDKKIDKFQNLLTGNAGIYLKLIVIIYFYI